LSVIVIDEDYLCTKKISDDVISSLAAKTPIIVLQKDSDEAGDHIRSISTIAAEQVTLVSVDKVKTVLATISMLSGQDQTRVKTLCLSIPYYNTLIAISRLRENGGLGIVTIDASNFSRIGLEYGVEVYKQLREVFHDILFEMWGKVGSFRENDVICQKSGNSNIYYLLLSRSRETGSLPLPGALEKFSDRLSGIIQNRLLSELVGCSPTGRRLPSCIKSMPTVGVGFTGVLYNPCIDPYEIIDRGLEASLKMSQYHQKRIKERHKELMQTLIQSQELLYPNYQAIFSLQGITEEMVRESHKKKSIAPLKKFLYGFESLIRVDQVASRHFMTKGILGYDPRCLRPDVLFAIAADTKVGLELDQTCLRLAVEHGKQLPGVLMINILPRNFYHVDKLIHYLGNRENVVLEVSESEGINNFDLFMKSCAYLAKRKILIAADDFGRGYSSLERVLKLKPAIIKFDRSIVSHIHEDPIKQAYVKGLVEAGKYLNAVVLAEGIEQWEEAKLLQEIGVELIQGFLLHMPQEISKVLGQLGVEENDLGAVA
jgi:EAL domain-containing protein (putative c-di-GMP-specific phosphodiesterase class I)